MQPDGAIADPGAFPDPPAPPSKLALVHRPAAAQSELRLGHVALPRRSPDYHAALVANMVLGGQFVSRINMNLREDKGYTYGARTAFEFRRAPNCGHIGEIVEVDRDDHRPVLLPVRAQPIESDKLIARPERTGRAWRRFRDTE